VHGPSAASDLLTYLTSAAAAALAGWVTGIEGLQSDPALYGGGLHVTEPGGFLGIHLDSERHPNTGLVRRLNLIVYCTPGWQEGWGGELELWDRGISRCVQRIAPAFNRAVLLETGPHCYHGHPRPVTGPLARKSVAVFYWSEPRGRARFVRTADEPIDAEREEWRLQRSRAQAD
jgi:Rps23 Pro-64 3,4-dihydroxylase Tpa1-like proline 4-hydroxylase